MKHRLKTAVGLMAFAAIALAPAASADECGQPAQEAAYKVVVTKTPAVYGDDIVVIDVPGQPAVPGTPAVEEVSHIEHVLVTPAVEEVSHIEKVLVKEAWTEIVKEAEPGQHYSLKGNSGIGKDETPVWPADYWQANTEQEPHDNGAGNPVTWVETEGSGLHFASHGPEGEGLRDWFYYKAPVAAEVIEHEAEYEDVKVIDVPGSPAVYEDVKVIDVEAKEATPGTPAVPEVSHVEKGELITPAKRTTKTVLVSAAVPATDVCIVPASTPSASRLAQTGAEWVVPLAAAGILLLLAGAATVLASRRGGRGAHRG